jgi:hypothetical protein
MFVIWRLLTAKLRGLQKERPLDYSSANKKLLQLLTGDKRCISVYTRVIYGAQSPFG